MRCAGLDRPSVLHHCLDCESLHRTGKTFALGFFTSENGHGQMIADKTFVKIENQFGLCPRLSFRFVNSVALLPEKFSCPQKQTRPHLPTNDVCPLIDEDRQIAIRLHPSCVAGADDRFRSRPNHERFCQRTGRFHFSISVHLQPGVGYDGAFFGEAFDMFRFLREIT